MISAEAAPLLRRRFALIPLGVVTPGTPRAYQLSGLDRAPFPPATRMSAFVGRAAELGVLEACMARAIGGQGQIVGVAGEPGIGKSRLLREFRQTLGGEVTYLEGQCVSYGAGAPFLPIIDLVRAGCALAENASADTHRVQRTLGVLGLDPAEWAPFLLHLLGAPESERLAGLSAEAVNARTLEALVQMSLASSRRRPLVIAVEDHHWIDRVSETYLATLAGRIARARILLLVTYRPSSEPPSFLDRPDATRIALPPLTPEESADVARSLPGAAVDEDAARLIAARAGGNALFVEELALALADGGGESAGAAPAAAEAASRLPATLQGLLASRLDRLGPAKTVAQVAATIAHSFSVAMLQAAFDDDVAVLPDALRRLAGAEVIVPDGTASGEYRFRHALIRDAAYQSQTVARRREVHARVARALQTDFADHALLHPELAAHHLTEAGEQQAAIPWWVRAGTRARQRAAYADAIMELQKALDLLSALPPGAERDRTELEIQVSLGISLQATRGFGAPEVGRVHARARELCATVEGGPLVFGALGGLFLYYYFRSDLAVAREMAAQHRAVTEGTGAINRLCASYSALGFTAYQVGALEEARGHFERSIELADTYPRPEGTALTPNNIGVASESMLAVTLSALGRLDEAGRCAGRALARAERCVPAERAFSTGYAMTCASRVHLLRREPEEARRRAQDAMRIGREHGFALHVGAGLLADCAARIALGEAADEELAAALAAWRGRGLELDAPYWLGKVAEGRRAAGRLDDACATVDEAIAQMERHGERVHEAELYRLRGELIRERMPAAVGPAADDLERALAVARAQGAQLFALRAAMSVHRLRAAQGRAAESPLPAVLEAFTDHGADVRDARALLGGAQGAERR
jgi:tetratricopeptide (TPR) repeat protein